MGILRNKNNPDKWKNKYLNLLDQNEVTEKSYQVNEDLLCKTIVRLSLATTGFNKELDPYLIGIRKQLKNGLKSERLKAELEKFSSALMTLEENDPDDSQLDATLLFDFLCLHFPTEKKGFQQIEAKFEKNAYTNSQYLFIAINDLIDSIQNIKPLSDLPNNTLINDAIDSNTVNIQLQHILESVEIPAKFESRALVLKEKLYGNVSVAETLEETASLLFQIKKHLQSEQQEMAIFLAHLTNQLTELGIQASGAHSATNSSSKKRILLDQSVSSQMLDLQTSSKNAKQLEPLKQLIHTRLAEIALQIYEHRSQEQLERNEINQQLEYLTDKINEMERESCQLNKKLVDAYQTALHDPLTGLPNRLAYDERMEIELARLKRYQTPLCLLIWDIDLFKKINDSYGHKAGDKTLILIANLLSNHCRETDFVSRFGGEEFTMLLSNTNAESALITANKLRLIIDKTAFNSSGKKITITISCGITQFTSTDSGITAFNRADKALYQAKENGRNQCIIF
ncbi:MAG: GGDEF domain-containing protein [Methylococcaceae bacterium]